MGNGVAIGVEDIDMALACARLARSTTIDFVGAAADFLASARA
jgi:hypothetical protein